MAKLHQNLSGNYVFLLVILFFLGWAVQALVVKDFEFLFDRFFAAVMVALVWWVWRNFRISIPVLLGVGLAILLHQLKLYGNTYFGIEFDNIMHFFAAFAITALVYAVIDDCPSGRCHHPIKKMILTFVAAYGIASLIEPLEYLGYAQFGQGEGILFYGTGDGGWQDTAMDMFANMLGAIAMLGIIIAQKLWIRWQKYGWRFHR